MGNRRLMNVIQKHYNKQFHSQMHAIVDHSHIGLKKEVDSQSAKQGKASQNTIFKSRRGETSQLYIMYCIPKLCFKLACRIVSWCTNSTFSLLDCAIIMALACIASLYVEYSKIKLHTWRGIYNDTVIGKWPISATAAFSEAQHSELDCNVWFWLPLTCQVIWRDYKLYRTLNDYSHWIASRHIYIH